MVSSDIAGKRTFLPAGKLVLVEVKTRNEGSAAFPGGYGWGVRPTNVEAETPQDSRHDARATPLGAPGRKCSHPFALSFALVHLERGNTIVPTVAGLHLI